MGEIWKMVQSFFLPLACMTLLFLFLSLSFSLSSAPVSLRSPYVLIWWGIVSMYHHNGHGPDGWVKYLLSYNMLLYYHPLFLFLLVSFPLSHHLQIVSFLYINSLKADK